MATLSVVTDSPPETGGSPRRGRGWINLSPFTLPPCRGIEGVFLHATRRAECGGNCRKDSDYDVEDFAPSGVVVKCSHSGKIG